MGFEGLGVHKRSNSCSSFSGKNNKQEAQLVNGGLYVQPCTNPPPVRDNIIMGEIRKDPFNPTTALKHSSTTGTHTSMIKQEILQLEKRLHHQFEERLTLQKALGYPPSSISNAYHHHHDDNTPMAAASVTQLIKEIAALETEVVYLEQYLLSLYRKAFISSPYSNTITSHDQDNSPLHTHPPPSRAIDRASSAAVQSCC